MRYEKLRKDESKMTFNFSFGQLSSWWSCLLRWGTLQVEQAHLWVDDELCFGCSFKGHLLSDEEKSSYLCDMSCRTLNTKIRKGREGSQQGAGRIYSSTMVTTNAYLKSDYILFQWQVFTQYLLCERSEQTRD